MIVRQIVHRPEPAQGDQPTRPFWLTLLYDRQLGVWRATGHKHETPIAAARACLFLFLPVWRDIELKARTLRALIEHPRFDDLESNGIEPDIIGHAASDLVKAIVLNSVNIERLLDSPAPGDDVCIGGELFTVDPDTRELEPTGTSAPEIRSDVPEESPLDAGLLQALGRVMHKIEAHVGPPITVEAFKEMLTNAVRGRAGDETSSDAADADDAGDEDDGGDS